ncbi:MAG TPA: hypothetical protein VK348_02015, partial [Planctomycetota bacterium]|nr:hypothetical protein [Planctomycetota bacterium]
MRRPTVALCCLLGACAASVAGLVPDRVDERWRDDLQTRAVVAARHLHDRGRDHDALGELDKVLAQQPANVEALRLRQDVLARRGRAALVRSEAEALRRAQPQDAIAWYLYGRAVADPSDKEAAFRRATELAPNSVWPWLGLAFTLRERGSADALAIYQRLYAASDAYPVVGIAYAAALRGVGRYDEALKVYQQLRGSTEAPGVAELGQAQTLLVMENKGRESWPYLLAALRARPYESGVQQLVRDWLRVGAPDEQLEQLLDALRERPERLAEFAQGEGASVLLQLLQRLQHPHAALALLDGLDPSARSPALRRLHRRLLLATGDLSGFLALLRAQWPRALLADEGNQVRALWLLLLDGPWCSGEPLATASQSVQLVQALRDTGLLQEAEEVTEIARRLWPAVPELLALRDELGRELAFESGLRRLVYHGYLQPQALSLDQVLEELRAHALRTLGRDVVGNSEQFHVPLVGDLLDPFASGLCSHLARYNRHLVLGQRSGGTVEGLLLTRLSLRELPAQAELPLPGRCFEVVGENRELRSLTGVAGGDLAGVALLNHYVVDFDAVRDWAQGIVERRQVAREDGLAVVQDPLPEAAPLDPVDVAWRLSVVSPVQDTDLDAAVLEMIRCHERGHLVDSFYFLPIEANLWRALGLAFRFRLSPAAIEAEMERRAELAALALSGPTELVLAHIADFLDPGTASTPHGRGFRDLADDLIRA